MEMKDKSLKGAFGRDVEVLRYGLGLGILV